MPGVTAQVGQGPSCPLGTETCPQPLCRMSAREGGDMEDQPHFSAYVVLLSRSS